IFLPPEISPKMENTFAALLANDPATWHGENEIVTRSGERRLVRFSNSVVRSPSGKVVGTASIGEDITEIKLIQQALTESETRYYTLFENMLEGYAYCETIFEGDALVDFTYVEVNGAFETLTGLKGVAGKRVSDVIPGLFSSNPTVFETYGRVALTGKPEKFETYVQQLETWLAVTVYSSERTQFVAVFDNITERKRAQELLIESRQSLRLAAESAKLGIWDWDVVGNKMVWDAKMFELYSIRGEDFGGAYEAWQARVHPDDRQRADAEIDAALDGVKGFHTEFRVVLPTGEIRNLEAYADVLRANDGTPIRMIGVNWDITERMELEDQFRQAQKMEAVGVLAGGIAHDFNNLLTAINGYSDLMLRRLPDSDPNLELVRSIRAAGERAAGLTRQLLAFSRKERLETSVQSLNVIVEKMEDLLRRMVEENVVLTTRLDPAAGLINANGAQVEQILLNLVINARDAMPSGGEVRIETHNVVLNGPLSKALMPMVAGLYVALEVTDAGMGIAPEVMTKIFEPFFTTKVVGKGTGLGLAVVYGIVKGLQGGIEVDSVPGQGTTVRVYLPQAPQDRVPGRERERERESISSPAAAGFPGRETVLVVEDEPTVRKLIRHVLADLGYHVLTASNGLEALTIFEEGQAVDVLVTDLVMPGLGGRELAARVRERSPTLPILFMSGYSADVGIDQDVLSIGENFLAKPFTPGDLARKVREILDRR
ncbi:MAG: PAS domain-containing protein, partial [Myxococcales bacterium]